MLIPPQVSRVQIHASGGEPQVAGWAWTPTPFADFDLWLLRDGEAVLTTEEERLDLARGDCLLLPPGLSFRLEETRSRRTGRPSPLAHAFVHFDFLDARGRTLVPRDRPRLHRRLRHLDFVEELLDRMLRARRQETSPRPREAELWLLAALHAIAQEDDATALSGADRLHAERIGEICRAIRASPEKTFRVRDLARQCFYSVEHFTRLFRRFAGMSPGAFVLQARIEAARERLLDSTDSVRAIAERLGYCDVYFFCKQFRKKVGVSPGRFRTRPVPEP